MKQFKTKSMILLAFILLLSACGVLSTPEEASGPIEAVPLEIEETKDEANALAAVATTSTEELMEEPTAEAVAEPTAEPVAEPTGYPIEAPTAAPVQVPTGYPVEEPTGELAQEPVSGELTIFEINQEGSEVRFELDEDLRGNRFTVVGVTNQVAGQIALNYTDLSATQVGEIRINARTLATDNNFRNRAIQNEILDTGTYEFITFVPTAVNDLPVSVAIGDAIQFTIIGDLTIRNITSEATFTVNATAVSATEFSGTATAIVTRETYGLQIPSVPNVANVEEEVELYIDFSATAS